MCSIGDDGILCLAGAMREKYEEVSHLNVSGEDALSGLGIDNDISEDVRNEVMEQLKDIVFKIDI